MKKRYLISMLCLVLAMALVACSSGGASSAAAPAPAAESAASTASADGTAQTSAASDVEIYFVSKDASSSYWQTVSNGALAAGEALGIKVTVLAPNSESEIDKQISMVEQAATAGADAIVLAPLHPDSLVQACKDVMAAGIPFTIVDSLIATEDYDIAFMTDNYAAGQMAADELAADIDNKGEVFIINAQPGSQSTNDRESGFRDRIGEAYPDITIVGDTLFCSNDKILAANQTIDSIAAYPNLVGFYAPAETAMVGVGNGLKESGKAGTIKLVGFDSSDDSIALLEEGTITAMVLQDPFNMGYMGVEYALKIVNGETVEHGIVDTGAIMATQENMNDEVIQKLFYPLGK